VRLTTLPCKKKIVEKPPRNSAILNGRKLRRRPRLKLGCGSKCREREQNKFKQNVDVLQLTELFVYADDINL
jgi:hypothetical protein